MNARLSPLAMILDLNTDLLLNCLDGLSESEAQQRLTGGGNSIGFLAAHLTDSRHFLTSRLGHPLSNPLARFLADAKSIDEIRSWATLDEVRSAWNRISKHVQAVLDGLTDADLEKPGFQGFSVPDPTAMGFIAFLTQHDSYHIGQAGFVRRQLGKPAMTYDRRTSKAAAATSA
jgi:uncharacterized damage-inducible protein DinB